MGVMMDVTTACCPFRSRTELYDRIAARCEGMVGGDRLYGRIGDQGAG